MIRNEKVWNLVDVFPISFEIFMEFPLVAVGERVENEKKVWSAILFYYVLFLRIQ